MNRSMLKAGLAEGAIEVETGRLREVS